MFKIAAVALGLAVLGSARPMDGGLVRECRVGHVSFPVDVYESYAGWECYERTYPKLLEVYVCTEKSGDVEYSVPCFKAGSEKMSFNLKNQDTVLEFLYTFRSQESNDQMVRCYLDLVSACQFSPGGWLGGGYKTFLFNTTDVCALSGQSRFHVAMLSISLILTIPIVLIFSFCSRDTQNTGVCHCRNVLMALACRTFFTLLVETEIMAKKTEMSAGEMDSWAGCEALASFEAITLNLVLAFWVIFTFFLLEYSKNGFVEEPDVKRGAYIVVLLCVARQLDLYRLQTGSVVCIVGQDSPFASGYPIYSPFGVICSYPRLQQPLCFYWLQACLVARFGLSLAMPVIWMIIMGAGEYGMCWMEKTPVHWVNDSLRMAFIIVQVVLISIAAYHVLTDPATVDDIQKDPLRRAVVFTLALSSLFLLQFSLNAGHAVDSDNAYVYTEHFFDGMQSGIVSLSYLFIMGVHEFLMDKVRLRSHKKCHIVLETAGNREIEIGGAPKRAQKPAEDCPEDVIYSSVLTPERFEKTIQLYNRLNIIPQHGHTGIGEDVPRNNPDNASVVSDYYDVESIHTVYDDVLDNTDPNLTSKRGHRYYDSKYLVHDTDSSVSDDSVKEAPKPESPGSQIPCRESERVKAMEFSQQNYRHKFQDRVDRQMKDRNYNVNGMHRSVSAVLLSSWGTPESVKVNIEKSSRTRRASAPSVLLPVKPATFFSSPPENGLPSIYDDLKHAKRPKPRAEGQSRRPRIVIRIGTGNRLLQNRRQARSVGAVEEPKKRDYGSRLNALLSPRYDVGELEPGDLRNNKFSYNTERLNVEAADCEDEQTKECADSESTQREPCRN